MKPCEIGDGSGSVIRPVNVVQWELLSETGRGNAEAFDVSLVDEQSSGAGVEHRARVI